MYVCRYVRTYVRTYVCMYICTYVPIVKPGKEGSDDVSKFLPISLLDTGGKALESDPVNEQPKHGEGNKQRVPAGILLRPRFLELTI